MLPFVIDLFRCIHTPYFYWINCFAKNFAVSQRSLQSWLVEQKQYFPISKQSSLASSSPSTATTHTTTTTTTNNINNTTTTHNIATNNKSNKNINNSNDSTTTYNNNISVEKRKLIWKLLLVPVLQNFFVLSMAITFFYCCVNLRSHCGCKLWMQVLADRPIDAGTLNNFACIWPILP